jgi:hypothetical protein
LEFYFTFGNRHCGQGYTDNQQTNNEFLHGCCRFPKTVNVLVPLADRRPGDIERPVSLFVRCHLSAVEMNFARTPLPVAYNFTIIGWRQPWDREIIPAIRASFWNVLRILKSAPFNEKTSFRVIGFGIDFDHIAYFAPVVKPIFVKFRWCVPLTSVQESKLHAAA